MFMYLNHRQANWLSFTQTHRDIRTEEEVRVVDRLKETLLDSVSAEALEKAIEAAE